MTAENYLEMHRDRWFQLVDNLLEPAGIRLNGAHCMDIQVRNPLFCKRVLQQGSLGLGESYMEGWWDCARLDQLFERVLRAGLDRQLPARIGDLLSLLAVRLFNPQSRRRAWQVGEVHYDLGNDLFSLMLDSHMQYSCGYWAKATTLEQAQQDKLRLICEKLQLRSGQRLLDIGCGWGGLAEYAARHYGVSVVGITISREQQQMAQARCRDLPVEIRLQDYRDLNEPFDAIVSVGMFEHVGPKNYPHYFAMVARCLRGDGLFLLHSIGSNRSDLKVDPWINRYIFPNGCLPSAAQITRAIEGEFVLEDWHNFGADYDRTLMAWLARFQQSWPRLNDHYPPRFYRMFSYYLACCAGAFRARDIQLWQLLLSPRGVAGGVRVPR